MYSSYEVLTIGQLTTITYDIIFTCCCIYTV